MEIKRIQLTPDHSLEYGEQGNIAGPVFICLHGISDSILSFQLLMPYLPENFHVYALSQRGHGNSDRPAFGYDPKDFAADVALFMDQLQIGSAIIVGHSMGGVIAQRFAIDYPEKIRALVLIDTFSGFAGNEAAAELVGEVNAFGEKPEPVFVEAFQRGTIAREVPETFMQQVIRESLKVPPRVWKAIVDDLVKSDFTGELKAVRMPALLVWGDQDKAATRNDQVRLLEAIDGSRLLVYQGIGHTPQWEVPRQLARDIEDFAREVIC